MHLSRIKDALDTLYRNFDFSERLKHDPIEFPHRYSDDRDIEIVGFISAVLAYGKISVFKSVLEDLLKRIGQSPSDFVREFDLGRHAPLLKGMRYRFNSEEDFISLFFLLSQLTRRFGTLEAAFLKRFDGREISTAIDGFRRLAEETLFSSGLKVNRSFWFLLPSPSIGSACKRINLFLRWMVRDRDIDFGIWKGFRKNQLVIPLDTHIARIGRCLGFTKRKTKDWKMAIQITSKLKEFDPEDPLKYDFALCHQGVVGVCRECSRSDRGCQVFREGTLIKQR